MDRLEIDGPCRLQGEVRASGAKNAAYLAAQMLSLGEPALAGRLEAEREENRQNIRAQNAALQEKL